MKEDFLHYIWRFKKFDLNHLLTTRNEKLSVIYVGHYLQTSGPDFFNAQIIINEQKWAGSVEIHIKSSDWYLHNHQNDAAYENVILHVVWEHDTDVFRRDNSAIPVLQIKDFVDTYLVENYYKLLSPKSWIFCESHIGKTDKLLLNNLKERLFFERLERKSQPIFELLKITNSDWEAVLFYLLAKNFGLNSNGDAFLNIAQSITFSVFRKETDNEANLESLLFGFAGLLNFEFEEQYPNQLQKQFVYLVNKFKLPIVNFFNVEFFKHRPDNFPTIRLAQLAEVYHKNKNLFADVLAAASAKQIYDVFLISVNEYWLTHYQLDRVSPKKKKNLSKSFIDLLIINTIVPLRFAYAKSRGSDTGQNIFDILYQMSPETNIIISKFRDLGVEAKDAMESQALLQLKNEYCNKGHCLKCSVGAELMRSTAVIM